MRHAAGRGQSYHKLYPLTTFWVITTQQRITRLPANQRKFPIPTDEVFP